MKEELSLLFTVTPWLIQAHGSVCKCFFILVKEFNINNAHRGLSSDCLLAKFNMKAACNCTVVPFYPLLPLNGSDRGMWPVNSNWRSYGDWVSLRGSSIDPRDGKAGQAALHPSQLLLSAAQAAKEHSVLSQELSGVQVTLQHSQTSR